MLFLGHAMKQRVKQIQKNSFCLRGIGQNGQNDQISIFCSKSDFRYGGITSQIFRGLAALEPPQDGGQRGGFVFSFSIENKKENGKNILYIL